MDQKKIGRFVSETRKGLGLTQAQLGERLGVSDKSVSKWERGICLPDASLYMDLCEELGISINELFAGERILPEEQVKRSEENIVGIVGDGQQRHSRLRRVTVALGVIAAVLAIVLVAAGIALQRSGAFIRNYVRPYSMSGSGREVAGVLAGPGSAHLFEYSVDGRFSGVEVHQSTVRNGVVTEDQVIAGAQWGVSDEGDESPDSGADVMHDGIIAITMNDAGDEYRCILADVPEGGMVDQGDALETGFGEGEGYYLAWSELCDPTSVEVGDRVMVYACCEDGTRVSNPDIGQVADVGFEAWAENDVCYVFSCEFL